jgi:hypothetical protein
MCTVGRPPLGTRRLGIRGQRQLVFAHTAHLLAHLTAADGGKAVQLVAANNWLKTASEASAKAFMAASGTELFCCTAGSSDAVYCPAGYIFHEKITGVMDFAGVRVPIVSLSALDTLTAISRHLIKVESPSIALQRILDCLALAE